MRKYDKAMNLDYTIALECGCRFRTRLPPMSGRQGLAKRYACPSGVGHGYQLRWVRWDGKGFGKINPGV